MSNNYCLTPLQSRLIVMFDWFHRFCVENSIQYYALGGTMLGAARHQGFIPWDDDIDVGLPRKDYENLKLLLANKQIDNYVLEMPDSENLDFATPYAKLYDVTTTLIENYRKPLKRGIFIDIFPLDGLDNDFEIATKKFNMIKNKYNYLMTKVASLNSNREFYKNAAIVLSRCLPSNSKTVRNLRMEIDDMCQKNDFFSCEFGGNILGNWGMKEIMSNSIMGTPVEYDFNGIKIYGAEKYDKYLSHLYGDWRKLPPKEKQITHHDYLVLDLNRSYLV